MSLNQILNELQDDVTNISTEQIQLSQTQDSKFKLNSTNLDKKVIDKFNILYNVITTKKAIYPLSKVDFKIAQEVFTMLPEITKTDQAKITSYPSTINKNVINGILQNVNENVPEEMVSSLKDISKEIINNAENIDTVIELVKSYVDICGIEDKRLTENKPIVIDSEGSVNLFQEDLMKCSYINDENLHYVKYSGKLSEMYRNLAFDPTLSTFLNYGMDAPDGTVIARIPEVSLQILCERVINLQNEVINNRAILITFQQDIEKYSMQEVIQFNENIIYHINNINLVIDVLKRFKMLFDILDNKENFFEKMKNLLQFLD